MLHAQFKKVLARHYIGTNYGYLLIISQPPGMHIIPITIINSYTTPH